MYILFFKKILFLERGERREMEGEKYQCVVASRAPPTGDLTWNPGRCPDRDQTGDPLFPRLELSLLSHTNQG